MDYKEIIERILRADKTGLEALYNGYGQKFYGFAVKNWGLSEDDAWEVVYQTLDTLVLKLPGYEFESKQHFDNFLFKVFVNFLRQLYRKHRNRQIEIVGADNLFGESMISEDEQESMASNEEELEVHITIDNHAFTEYYTTEHVENPKLIALKKALEELEEQERDILLLRAQDYSYEEIAKMLNIENKQLKVKHHRIKSRLIQIINKNLPSNEQLQNHRLPERSP